MKQTISIALSLAILLIVIISGLIVGLQKWSWNDNKIQFLTWRLSNSEKSERSQLVREISRLTTTQEALSIINNSGLPVDGELHLLTHVVGETLYKRSGVSSMWECSPDQLYGCIHGLLISAMTNEGFEVVKVAVHSCQDRSLYQYHMCLHAAGHGFLAYTDYEIEPALKYCDEIGGDYLNLNHCYVGVFMENVHGVHDGKPAYTHPSLSVENPIAPCDSVGQQYRPACYLNQVGWWVQLFEGDYQRVGEFCLKIPKIYQTECANNYGRVLSTAFNNHVTKILDNCDNVGEDLSTHCVASVATSMAGMSANETALEMCSTSKDEAGLINCYNKVLDLWENQNLLHSSSGMICETFSNDYKYLCTERMKND